jgi:8-oxo-dGTP diphosphatase
VQTVRVVAAVIERNGRILIGQRRRGAWHELQWEFPGGKVELGEEPAAALVRELREELDIQARIGEQMASYPVNYPGRTPIELLFYAVTDFDGEPRNLCFESIVWARPEELPAYDFLEGDRDFVRRLADTEGSLYRK